MNDQYDSECADQQEQEAQMWAERDELTEIREEFKP